MSALRTILCNWSREEAQRYFEERTRSQYLGNGRVLCQVLGELRMIVLSDYAGFAPHMIFEGYWEYWLSRFFAERVQAGDTVLDIGANHGYFTLLAGELVGETGQLVAYEPNPDVFACLAQSVTSNGFGGNSRIINAAVANVDEPTKMPFLRDKNEPHNGRLKIANDSHKPQPGEAVSMVEVQPVRPEDFERLDMIKIDVEGSELIVLDALKDVIETHNPTVVCEVNFHRNYSFEDIALRLGKDNRLAFLDVDAVVKPLTEAMTTSLLDGRDLLIVRNPV